MRLQLKTTLTVLLVFICLIAVVSAVGWRLLTHDYANLEAADAQKEIARLQRILAVEHASLIRSARDYAEWDDTVAFLQDRNTAYVEENWMPATLGNLNVQMVLAYAPGGAFVDGAHTLGGPAREFSEQIVSSFVPHATRVAADPSAATRVHGLIRSGDRLLLFACVPVRNTEGKGVPRGALVHVRSVDERLVSRLGEIAGHPVQVSAADVPEAASGPAGAPISIPSPGHLRITSPLHDVDGSAIGSIAIDLPRRIAAAGARARWLLLVEVVLTGALFGGVVVFLVRWMVTARLERLSAALRRVAAAREGSTRVPVEGDDEIALVARETNAMLDALARNEAEREHARREREALQQQLLQAQKMEAVGEFAGGIAHDFNNCLTSITSWVQLVHDDLPPDHEGRAGLADALQAARHAALVVRQLLAYSRPAHFALAPVHVGELVTESLGLLRSALRRTTELRVHASGGDDLVMADRTQLLQVLMNLLNNAKDAMGETGTLTISIGETELPAAGCPGAAQLAPGRYVRVKVEDTGPGIPAGLLDKVFKPFFTTKGKSKGTGLGLAVVQNVVTRHGGAVGVSSVPGRGATFHVYLPRLLAPPVAASPDASPARDGCRVLVAEDDPSVQRAVARVLEKRSYHVTCADDGSSAWQMIEAAAEPFDVVITDLTMPGLTGLQLMERIASSGHAIPVVLMTAYATTLNPRQVRDAGFAAILAKPVMHDEILATVDRLGRN